MKGEVLVVDDEPALCRALSRTLEMAGFKVEQAGSGTDALAIVTAKPLDVIVSDITMPQMNGLELLRAVRERDLDVPVILMTGNPTIDTATQAVEHGALRYLLKPVSSAALIENVERATKLRRMARLKREAAELFGSEEKLLGDRAALEMSLSRAMQTVWMAYQPIVHPATRRVVAYEALVRTREPTIPHPGVLFSVAERLDRVAEVGRAVRAQVAATLSSSDVAADIFVNLHAQDLLDDDLFDSKAPLTCFARRVVLEITERVALDHHVDVPARIKRLRTLGFRIALDDLGAGYAGLSYFALLTPDVVKLDISLVRDVDRHTIKQRLVGSFSSLCKELGMAVVAEGIETEAEREMVTSLGTELLQGYRFARPGPPFPEVRW